MQRGKKEMKYEMKKVERNFWFVTPEGITEDSRILNEKIYPVLSTEWHQDCFSQKKPLSVINTNGPGVSTGFKVISTSS